MNRLQIQLQVWRSPGLNAAEAVARLARLADGVRVTEGEDNGRYFSIDFTVSDLSGLWNSIRAELRSLPGLAEAAIIVCEGTRGWDDYLLLHHFDARQDLDDLS